MQQIIFNTIIIIFVLEFLFERILSYLNQRSWKAELPEQFKEIYDAEKYQKAREYSQINSKVGTLGSVLSFVVILLALFMG